MKRTTNIPKLPFEVVLMAAKLSDAEARLLVANYYWAQEMRKRADMQIRHLGDKELPILLKYTADSAALVEDQVRKALKQYAESKKIGEWMMSHFGIAEVLAAGMLAHLSPEHPLMERELTQYPDKKVGEDMVPTHTVGHWWRFAGLDPTAHWEKGEKRPWNAALKQVCFHMGECFKRVSGKGSLKSAPRDGTWIEIEVKEDEWRQVQWAGEHWIDNDGMILTIAKPTTGHTEEEDVEAEDVEAEDIIEVKKKKWRPGWRPVGRLSPSFYGGLYRERKEILVKKNEDGHFAERAKTFITKSKDVKALLKQGKLPAGNLDRQACRFATKIFLSHLHAVWYWDHFGKPPPKPFAISILGHANEIRIPNTEMFPGFAEAYYGEGRLRKSA